MTMAKQSITIPRAAGRIKTYRPTGNGNSHLVELIIDVTKKDYDAAVEDIFAGYIQTVANMSMTASPAQTRALTKKPAEVNLTITSGGEPEETVLRWIGAVPKAPKLIISADGATAELHIGIVGPLDNDTLCSVATYRGADAMIAIEPHQLDLEDEAEKAAPKKPRAPRRRAGVQVSMLEPTEPDTEHTHGDEIH
jgi:hypothetical protein